MAQLKFHLFFDHQHVKKFQFIVEVFIARHFNGDEKMVLS